MNKFEQVSSDHHQMSQAGGRLPGLISRGYWLPCDLSHDAFDVICPPPEQNDKQTPLKNIPPQED